MQHKKTFRYISSLLHFRRNPSNIHLLIGTYTLLVIVILFRLQFIHFNRRRFLPFIGIFNPSATYRRYCHRYVLFSFCHRSQTINILIQFERRMAKAHFSLYWFLLVFCIDQSMQLCIHTSFESIVAISNIKKNYFKVEQYVCNMTKKELI